MLKRDEIADPKSCLNRAREDELVFTLLERDVAAPAAIRAWIGMRISMGKNKFDDPQIQEAHAWIRMCEASLREAGKLS